MKVMNRTSNHRDHRIRAAFWGVLLLLFSLLLSSCRIEGQAGIPESTAMIDPPATSAPITPDAAPTEPPSTAAPPAVTPTPAASMPPAGPTPTPPPAWIWHEAGEVAAPILLYHHVGDGEGLGRYQVTEQAFQEQMEILQERGYQTITVAALLEAMLKGASLPPKPVIISFDDGNQSVFDAAYPMMRKYGYIGAAYIVANRLDVEGFMGVEDLQTLADSGWEIGSHSMSHLDLAQSHADVRREVLHSQLKLQDEVGVPIETFAYPFGQMDGFVASQTRSYGYTGAVGLGISCLHDRGSVFYLSRVEITREITVDQFKRMLERADDPDLVFQCGSWSQ